MNLRKKKNLLLIVTMMIAILLSACSNTNESENDNTSSVQPLGGYIFEAKETSMHIDEKAKEVLDKLGEPADYFEAPSCAFEGVDKTYTYGSFTITTYQEKDIDYIGSIVLKDDLVSTKEGLSLYMTKEEMESIYGTEYEQKSDMFIYKKDQMRLKIVISNGEITSIEYSNTKLIGWILHLGRTNVPHPLQRIGQHLRVDVLSQEHSNLFIDFAEPVEIIENDNLRIHVPKELEFTMNICIPEKWKKDFLTQYGVQIPIRVYLNQLMRLGGDCFGGSCIT